MIFIAIRAARDVFAIIRVECGASFHAVLLARPVHALFATKIVPPGTILVAKIVPGGTIFAWYNFCVTGSVNR